MNRHFSFNVSIVAITGALLLGTINKSVATPTPAKKPATAPATVQINTIPESVFLIPTNPKQGRDPFFPDSQRLMPTSISTNTIPPVVPPTLSGLTLQGISGTTDRRLAIVNGRTLAEGEETEVPIGSSRVRFRCVEIKTDSVVIEAGSERRELRLRPGS